MTSLPFPENARVDALAKVRGRAVYGADTPLEGMLHAMTVTARVAKGVITEIDTDAAMAVPGVRLVLTPQDTPMPAGGGDADHPVPPLLQSSIAYRGQVLALVVADTLEAAIEGAEAVGVEYAQSPYVTDFRQPDSDRQDTDAPIFGDVNAAFARATTTIEATYTTAANHHNPMELLSTTAVWSGRRLTVYEGTQAADTMKLTVAAQLSMDPADIDIVSPTIGGAFGLRGDVPRHSAVVAIAAQRLGRPVKLVMPRNQMFHNTRFRPLVRHSVRLGADAEGRMIAARYDTLQQNSRAGRYPADWYHVGPTKTYGIANYHGTSGDLRLDTQNPAQMRSPFEYPASFAFESAVDELAYAVGRDPLDFRLAHETDVDPTNGNPLTNRTLNECFRQGAERFGWSSRSMEPGSMTRPDGSLVGWGMGGGVYMAAMHPAVARLRVSANGTTRFATSGHEMGQGMRSAIAQALISGLEIDPERLEIVIGDTRAAPQHRTAGSWGTASSVPIAAKAAKAVITRLDELLDGRDVPGNIHEKLYAVRRPFIEVDVEMTAPGQTQEHIDRLKAGEFTLAGQHGAYPEFTALSYIAHFAEVTVEPSTGQIRVPRVVSVADCGRVASPRTARSQVLGGVVWTIGAVFREISETDPRFGGWLNSDIAEYLIPVNADIGEIDVSFLDIPDYKVNPVGVKGLGELAMVGIGAALANAVFHATGRRFRDAPIRVEDLLAVNET
ncbi:MAG: xanthine dehydrogenase family protein molybdopterin-binding subunit [Roseovarius sp.]